VVGIVLVLAAAAGIAWAAGHHRHHRQLVGCVPAGPSLVSHGPQRREIALTLDDGPSYEPPTISFVRLLARYHVPATFFELGGPLSSEDPTGSLQRLALADGDMIGDHTWSHVDMATLSPREQTYQLEETAHSIARTTGFTPCLWRPPYGDISPQLIAHARALGFITVLWDVDPRDWALPGVGAIVNDVVDDAHDGAIVIEHDGGGPRYETLAALPREITALRARGYQFVTVTKMLGLRLIYK
jgi:peptidoglycan/xylan/chitin deacetylase (PgdA/CDA1 family)